MFMEFNKINVFIKVNIFISHSQGNFSILYLPITFLKMLYWPPSQGWSSIIIFIIHFRCYLYIISNYRWRDRVSHFMNISSKKSAKICLLYAKMDHHQKKFVCYNILNYTHLYKNDDYSIIATYFCIP